MKKLVESVILLLLFAGIYFVLPTAIVWGWVRWMQRTKLLQSLFSVLPLVGFSFATLSGLLAISSMLYAHAIGGFPFYDPRLFRVYRWGLSLSLGGMIFGLSGLWRSNPLRWHAPACAAGTFLFWVVMALGE